VAVELDGVDTVLLVGDHDRLRRGYR